VKELVTMHRRKISLVSNEATGTMFTAYLPLKKGKKEQCKLKYSTYQIINNSAILETKRWR
jgi:hypothetical protein